MTHAQIWTIIIASIVLVIHNGGIKIVSVTINKADKS